MHNFLIAQTFLTISNLSTISRGILYTKHGRAKFRYSSPIKFKLMAILNLIVIGKDNTVYVALANNLSHQQRLHWGFPIRGIFIQDRESHSKRFVLTLAIMPKLNSLPTSTSNLMCWPNLTIQATFSSFLRNGNEMLRINGTQETESVEVRKLLHLK